MRPRTASIIAGAYRAVSREPVPEEPVELAPDLVVPRYLVNYAAMGRREAQTFLTRMPAWLDLRDRTVLDVGCGAGALGLEAARRGARRVLGVDIGSNGIRFAQRQLRAEAPNLPVEYRVYGGSPDELEHERFDVVLSKDSFERYGLPSGAFDPEAMLHQMADRLEEGGLLAMRLGPLWRTPYGGHIDSWLPWAHLIFPERVVFDEYRRARRSGKTARSFEEGVGVNRMTLARFRGIMGASGLECLHFATNVSDRPAAKVVRALSRVRALEELLVHNIYGVWRRPPGWRRAR